MWKCFKNVELIRAACQPPVCRRLLHIFNGFQKLPRPVLPLRRIDVVLDEQPFEIIDPFVVCPTKPYRWTFFPSIRFIHSKKYLSTTQIVLHFLFELFHSFLFMIIAFLNAFPFLLKSFWTRRAGAPWMSEEEIPHFPALNSTSCRLPHIYVYTCVIWTSHCVASSECYDGSVFTIWPISPSKINPSSYFTHTTALGNVLKS